MLDPFQSLELQSDIKSHEVYENNSCEIDPNRTCVLKAFIKLYHSLKCSVEVTQPIRDSIWGFENAVSMCSENNRKTEKTKDFCDIIENIMNYSENLNNAANLTQMASLSLVYIELLGGWWRSLI